MFFDGDDGNNGSGGDEGQSTVERAAAYLEQHPLHGPEPEAKPADTTAAAGEKTPEQIAAEAEAAKGEQKTPEQIAAEKTANEQKTPEQLAAEKKAAEQGTLDEKAVLAHPKFVELKEKADANEKVMGEFKAVLEAGDFQINSPEELKLQLADAALLYHIVSGKKSVTELLDLLDKNKGWTETQKQAVLLDLADYLETKGVKKGALDPRDPVQREVLNLREQNTKRDEQTTQAAIEKTRRDASDWLDTTVSALCKKAGVTDAQDIADYELVIAAQIGRDPKQVEQFEKKNAALIERLFTGHHNREIARQKRWLDSKIAAKENRKIPTGGGAGGGPTPPEKKRDNKDLRTSEGRIARAKEVWEESGKSKS